MVWRGLKWGPESAGLYWCACACVCTACVLWTGGPSRLFDRIKGDMVVIRYKVTVTFEAVFDIQHSHSAPPSLFLLSPSSPSLFSSGILQSSSLAWPLDQPLSFPLISVEPPSLCCIGLLSTSLLYISLSLWHSLSIVFSRSPSCQIYLIRQSPLDMQQVMLPFSPNEKRTKKIFLSFVSCSFLYLVLSYHSFSRVQYEARGREKLIAPV